MEEGTTEMFSNPIAPLEEEFIEPSRGSQADVEATPRNKLSNSDFRKLLLTHKSEPKVPGGDAADTTSAAGTSADGLRKKKKPYHPKVKKDKEKDEEETAKKYRDRAKERREGKLATTTAAPETEDADNLTTTADYRAVAPTASAGATHAERRRQLIEESKYLGGDMEHTYLVKGLDFALLEKVRKEIHSKEREAVELDDAALDAEDEGETGAAPEAGSSAPVEVKRKHNRDRDVAAAMEDKIQFNTRLGKEVFRVLFKSKPPERNELFAPGRMAYRVELEEEFAELDVPTTVIRSKADCAPITDKQATSLTTNEMVIHKLTQILSYLRVGRRQAKKNKAKGRPDGMDKEDEDKPRLPEADMDIYDNVGDYNPSKRDKHRDSRRGGESGKERRGDRDYEKERERGDRDRDRDRGDRNRDRDRGDRDRQRDRHRESGKSGADHYRRGDRDREGRDADDAPSKTRSSYFERPEEEREGVDTKAALHQAKEVVRDLARKAAKKEEGTEKNKEKDRMDRIRRKTEISGYDECYPGFVAYDAMGDSDEEADYSQMDLGNKKGPVGRWDFESQEEYSKYMSNKEALPKAAFQYGVKMADGRRTRRVGPKDEKAELNRQWQRIQTLMNKRKGGDDGGGGPDKKHSRYDDD